MNSASFFKEKDINDKRLSIYLLGRDLLLTLFVGGFASFLNYLFTLTSINNMSEISYGVFSSIMGLIFLIQIPATALQTYFAKTVARDKRYQDRAIMTSIFRDFIRYSLVLSLLLIIVAPFLSNLVQLPTQYLLLISVVVFALVLTPVTKGFLLGMRKVGLFNIFTILESFLKLIFILIAFNFSSEPGLPILAYGLPSLIIGVLIIRKLLISSIKSEKEIKQPKIDTKYLLIALLTLFFFNSSFSIDVVLLSPNIRAPYAALAIFGKIVFYGSILFSSVLFSYFVNTKDRDQKNKYLFFGMLLNVCVSISLLYVYIFFGDILVKLMFQGEYGVVYPFLLPIGVGVMFYSLAYIFIQYLLSEEEWFQIIILVCTFLLQIALYINGNDSLYFAIRNQVLSYATIAISIILFWYHTERKFRTKYKLKTV